MSIDVESLRKLFPITENYNFQDHAAVAPISRRVAEAMKHQIDVTLEAGYLGEDFYRHADRVRGLAARLINAHADEITFVKNTSEGLAFVANGLKWNTGDNIVTTKAEFPANIYPWMSLQSQGVRLKMVLEEDGRIPLENIIRAMDGRTRLVAISAVQFGSGFQTDLRALGQACQERGVLLCVDAIQALGAVPVDVREMNIDFLSADGHKWLCGPEGCGIFFVRRELLGHLRPTTVGWLCMKNAWEFGKYRYELRDDARRFDSGAYNLVGICGLGAAIELILEIGVPDIYRRILALTDRLVAGLRERGYRVISSRRPGEASGIVAFLSDQHDHERIRQHLRQEHRVVISHRLGRLRASPHVYNTEAEIDQLVSLLPGH